MGTPRHHQLILGSVVLLAAAQGGAGLSRGLGESGGQNTPQSLLAAQSDGRGRWTPVLLQQQAADRCWRVEADGRIVALEAATNPSASCSVGSLTARLSLQPAETSNPGDWRFQLRRQGSNLSLQARSWRNGERLDLATGSDPGGDRNDRAAPNGELIALTPLDNWSLQGARLVASATTVAASPLPPGLPPPPPPLSSQGDGQRVVALAVIPWRPVDKLVANP